MKLMVKCFVSCEFNNLSIVFVLNRRSVIVTTYVHATWYHCILLLI